MTGNFQIYRHKGEFSLESGQKLINPVIAYHTWGEMTPARDNVVWVCHALTANSDVADWWPGTIEPGRFLDPADKFIICANILGSCYGTTGPLHINPTTGKPYYRDFPLLTMRDLVNAHRLLAQALGINRIHAMIGSSVGGFQALEWVAAEPQRFDKLVLIATDAKASPWTIAIDETQRMAIEADPSYFTDTPQGGRDGLAAARAIGLLTYRGASGYNLSQQDSQPDNNIPIPAHRACSYQRYQGKKLVDRFDAYSYMSILQSFDTHNIGRDRGGVAQALARITSPTIVVSISTDIIFTPPEMQQLAQMIPGARYNQIDSKYGHDGFLVEADLLNSILIDFLS